MQDSILNYEKELKKQVFLNPKSTECQNYNILKLSHKKLREESLQYFRDKAVG
jgi:hypothetical protein